MLPAHRELCFERVNAGNCHVCRDDRHVKLGRAGNDIAIPARRSAVEIDHPTASGEGIEVVVEFLVAVFERERGQEIARRQSEKRPGQLRVEAKEPGLAVTRRRDTQRIDCLGVVHVVAGAENVERGRGFGSARAAITAGRERLLKVWSSESVSL